MNNTVLNAVETYDGGDDDLAPDDGAWAQVANILEPRPATVFAICKS